MRPSYNGYFIVFGLVIFLGDKGELYEKIVGLEFRVSDEMQMGCGLDGCFPTAVKVDNHPLVILLFLRFLV